jgi:hypothetical protein
LSQSWDWDDIVSQEGSSTGTGSGTGTRLYPNTSFTSIIDRGNDCTEDTIQQSPDFGWLSGTVSEGPPSTGNFESGWDVSPSILVVDDDPVNRQQATKFLQTLGYSVGIAVDGEVAVKKMKSEEYDLVLMVSNQTPLVTFPTNAVFTRI